MNRKIILFTALLVAVFAVGTFAQTTSKVAIIDTEAFSDPKNGITKLVNAFKTVEGEFKPRRDEITTLQNRYSQLVKDIETTKSVASQAELTRKADEAESIKRDLERKQQDGQRALDKRVGDVTGPIYTDVGTALLAFAKARGHDIVFDVAKMQGTIMVVNEGIDITKAFIADYNSKNGGVPVAPKP